jgi:hypothetical protein
MLPDLVEDLVARGKAVGLVLRVDALAVERHVEDPAVTALEAGGDSELLLDGGLQTGGLWVVVSFGAVGDLDVHAPFLLSGPRGTDSMISDPTAARAR